MLVIRFVRFIVLLHAQFIILFLSHPGLKRFLNSAFKNDFIMWYIPQVLSRALLLGLWYLLLWNKHPMYQNCQVSSSAPNVFSPTFLYTEGTLLINNTMEWVTLPYSQVWGGGEYSLDSRSSGQHQDWWLVMVSPEEWIANLFCYQGWVWLSSG